MLVEFEERAEVAAENIDGDRLIVDAEDDGPFWDCD